MSASPAALIQAAIYLRNAAPQQWDDFVRAYAAHAEKRTYEVLTADAASIMTMKGAALEAQSTLEDFRNLDRYLRTSAPA